tara:strand:+ start:671 stop:1648 length:978 start_codon:yes stop_codon:yes gene_type:complete
MKKIITITLLVGVIAVLIWQQQKNTLKSFTTDFTSVNTAEIEQVYFADRYGNEVQLNKLNERWLVNGKHNIRNGALETFFSTLEKMKIKHPVSESMHNSVIKNLASEGVKVELYTQNKQLYKTFYVGGETADFLGTYMMIEGAKKAYVIHIPGFNGFLAPRFNIDGRKISSDLWRSRKIFEDSKIDSIELIYHEYPSRNFTLDAVNYNILYGNNQKQQIDSAFCTNYVKQVQKVNCEGFANDFDKKDSLLASQAFITLTVFYNNGTEETLETYHKKPKRKEYQDPKGNPLKYDVDRLYAFDGKDMLLIQYYTFNPILQPVFAVEK